MAKAATPRGCGHDGWTALMIIGRFLLRLLLVPLGGCIAICVAMLFVMLAQWNRMADLTADDYSGLMTFLVIVPTMGIGAGVMMLPSILGALIAEAFAIRSWIFHVANGGLSAWVSLVTIGALDKTYDLTDAPLIAVGAGIAAGFAYWAVAGWSAGFWKPVFGSAQSLALPPPPVAPAVRQSDSP